MTSFQPPTAPKAGTPDCHLSVERLSKIFYPPGLLGRRREAVTAVQEASLTVRRNSILGLVGESGSGKTTLARSILFLDPPTEGSVTLGGVELSGLSRRELRGFRYHMQIVFQDPNGALNPRLSVRGSIQEALTNRGIPRGEHRDRIAELLEMVGISPERMDQHPHEFSGGQKQRICIARALAMEPSFLVLDEPVSNLDVSIQAQIINLLLRLQREFELTYLFISHDLNLVGYISDEIAVMKDGRIVEQGAAESLLEMPQHPYSRQLFAGATSFHDRSEPGAYFVQEE